MTKPPHYRAQHELPCCDTCFSGGPGAPKVPSWPSPELRANTYCYKCSVFVGHTTVCDAFTARPTGEQEELPIEEVRADLEAAGIDMEPPKKKLKAKLKAMLKKYRGEEEEGE